MEGEYVIDTNTYAEVAEGPGQKDFTTLGAWKKTREFKLFFYKEIIPLLPADEKFEEAKMKINGYTKYVQNRKESLGIGV